MGSTVTSSPQQTVSSPESVLDRLDACYSQRAAALQGHAKSEVISNPQDAPHRHMRPGPSILKRSRSRAAVDSLDEILAYYGSSSTCSKHPSFNQKYLGICMVSGRVTMPHSRSRLEWYAETRLTRGAHRLFKDAYPAASQEVSCESADEFMTDAADDDVLEARLEEARENKAQLEQLGQYCKRLRAQLKAAKKVRMEQSRKHMGPGLR